MKSSKVVFKVVQICFNTLVVVALVAAVLMVGKSAYDFGYRIFAEPAMTSKADGVDISVQIKEDMSLMEVAELMEDMGLSRSKLLFYVQLQISDYSDGIDPGIYIVNTSMTPSEIITCLGTQETEANALTDEEVVETEEEVQD